jgi:hypothetical protein
MLPRESRDEIDARPAAPLVEHHEEEVVAAGQDVMVVRHVIEPVDEQARDVADVLVAFEGDTRLLANGGIAPVSANDERCPQLIRAILRGVRDARR